MKETPIVDPNRVGGGVLPVPDCDPPFVPKQPPQLPGPVPDPWIIGPDKPYEGPLF